MHVRLNCEPLDEVDCYVISTWGRKRDQMEVVRERDVVHRMNEGYIERGEY